MESYLDHASTTPLRPVALAAMLPVLTEHYGNPSAPNTPGRRARKLLDEARDCVAMGLGCRPGEVVFCSGGTEAANLAIFGAVAASTGEGPAICSAVEHHAVLRSVASLGGSTIGVGPDGVIDLAHLDSALGDLADAGRHPAVVAVMLANNEVGTIQPIGDVAEIVRRRAPDAAFFVDAVHAFPWLDVAELTACADLVAISAHKFGGPKGVGALVVRRGAPWKATARGGAQERERRPGTENLAGIAAMAAAIDESVGNRRGAVERIAVLRDRLADTLLGSTDGITETGLRMRVRGDRSGKVAGDCHLTIDDVEQDELLFLLDREGVYASAGSACASGASEPSHVLAAMSVPVRTADGGPVAALRLTLGHYTSEAEVDHACAVVPKVVEHLRAG